MNAADRGNAALAFLGRFFALVFMILGGVWALLTYFEPCAAASLCLGVPLIRQPHLSKAPRWWQRLVLQMRLLRLAARQRTARSDVQMLERDLAVHRALLDAATTDMEAEYHRDEIVELSELRDACHNDAAEATEQIAWARSDLGRL